MYKKTGMTDSAIIVMHQIISIDENMIGPYINLGLLYTEIDSLTKALEYYEKALVLAPDEPLIYSNRGFAYYKLGQYDLALADINKSLNAYPTNSYAFKNLALVYIKLELFEEACNALRYAENYGYRTRYGKEVFELQQQYCKNEYTQ